jgi:RND family efflux transporter MFP subunit
MTMGTDTHTNPPAAPPDGPPQPPVASPRRRNALSYVIVAALSIALGAVAMGVAGRFGWNFGFGRKTPAPSQTASSASADQMAGMSPTAEPPSDKAVYISPAHQQLIGVRTAEISQHTLDATIRATGVLAYDETRIAEIHTKIAGWIEHASVDFVGKPVSRGQALFSVYSPDLVATQKEYLLALRAQAQLGQSRFAETREGAVSLLAAARERLRLWDVTDAQVAELEKTGEPRKSVTLYSPFDGIVLERNAFPGQYVTPEMRMFKIADLSTIWVIGEIFEYELPLVRIGQEAEIQFPYGQAGRTVTGRITFVAPEVDAITRRVKVRIELHNPGVAFKPESYVTVLIRAGSGLQLAVPKEAVIDNGDKRYVILALQDGYFEPREIKVGAPGDEFYPVLAGLERGSRVVTSAQFLIDSETNLQAAMQSMASMPGMDNAGVKAGGNSGKATPAEKAAPQAAQAARVDIAFRSQPDPLEVGDNALEVAVKDSQGQPVTDATVEVTFFMPPMPSMGMPAMRSAATLVHAGGGIYRGSGNVPMAARWDVTVTVTRGGQRLGTKKLSIVAQ